MMSTMPVQEGACRTLHSMHKWHTAMFEKLGWMLLAKHQHRTAAIAAYLEGLKHLAATIQVKIKTTESVDKVTDLRIMATNVQILTATAHKLLA